MSETATTSAAELNAGSASARVAQATRTNAEGRAGQAHSVSPCPQEPNATAKPATVKPAAAKPVKIATPKAPSIRSFRHMLGAAVIKNAADFALKYKMPKDSPMTREDLLAQVGAWMSYVPGDFDPRFPMITAGGRRNVA